MVVSEGGKQLAVSLTLPKGENIKIVVSERRLLPPF